MCIRCFSHTFKKVQALFIAEMIEKGEESTEVFTSSVLKLKEVDIDLFWSNPLLGKFWSNPLLGEESLEVLIWTESYLQKSS